MSRTRPASAPKFMTLISAVRSTAAKRIQRRWREIWNQWCSVFAFRALSRFQAVAMESGGQKGQLERGRQPARAEREVVHDQERPDGQNGAPREPEVNRTGSQAR
jgi:hypothetical protein